MSKEILFRLKELLEIKESFDVLLSSGYMPYDAREKIIEELYDDAFNILDEIVSRIEEDKENEE